MRSAASTTLGTGILFVIVGLIFAAVGFFIMKDYQDFSEVAQETTAVVTNVESHRVRRNKRYRTEYDVYVQYEVNGNTYNVELNGGNGSMHEGNTLIVYYDPANPRDVRSSTSGGGGAFAMVFAFLISVLGAVFGLKPAIKSAKRKKLRETGAQATALITNITLDKSIKVNKRYPNKAECEVVDPVTGEKYLYSSEGYMNDISHLLGELVTVYYDPYDRSKYYVDLESVDVNAMGAGSVNDFR